MDKTDVQNLNFLIESTTDELAVWWETISEDERDYAMQLLKQYSEFLHEQESERQEEIIGHDTLWKESSEVLSRIMAK